jgi:hypothetical protein
VGLSSSSSSSSSLQCLYEMIYLARMGEMRNTRRIWSENLKGRDHTEDLVVDGKDNIRIDLRETGWKYVDWIHLAWIGTSGGLL